MAEACASFDRTPARSSRWRMSSRRPPPPGVCWSGISARPVGAGIYQEIQRAHIERACRMLVETNWSLADVARQCGFSNPVHFSVAFKRQMHLTPEQHRRGATKPIPDLGPSPRP